MEQAISNGRDLVKSASLRVTEDLVHNIMSARDSPPGVITVTRSDWSKLAPVEP